MKPGFPNDFGFGNVIKNACSYRLSSFRIRLFLSLLLILFFLSDFYIYFYFFNPCTEKGGLMDIDKEDLMFLVPPLFTSKDIPENLV